MPTRIGVVGFGSLGKFLVEQIVQDKENDIELAFVWNRTVEKVNESELVKKEQVLENLEEFATKKADLIVEVAHPSITKKYSAKFLEHADYFLGSPTALADESTEKSVMEAVESFKHCLYVPSGALWGASDIFKMKQRSTLKGLTITMAKHPSSLKICGDLIEKLEEAKKVTDKAVILYEGPVRQLCPMAPNNVNTMACAALAGIGFDKTQCKLISDARLESHDITIEIEGPTNQTTGKPFRCSTVRINPAVVGAVTGQATYISFFSSLLVATDYKRKGGLHFC